MVATNGNAGHGSLRAAEGQSLLQGPHYFSTMLVVGGEFPDILEDEPTELKKNQDWTIE